jgi:hypothetical protein
MWTLTCGDPPRRRRRWDQAGTLEDVPDIENNPGEQIRTVEQELLAAERHATLREAFMDLGAGEIAAHFIGEYIPASCLFPLPSPDRSSRANC